MSVIGVLWYLWMSVYEGRSLLLKGFSAVLWYRTYASSCGHVGHWWKKIAHLVECKECVRNLKKGVNSLFWTLNLRSIVYILWILFCGAEVMLNLWCTIHPCTPLTLPLKEAAPHYNQLKASELHSPILSVSNGSNSDGQTLCTYQFLMPLEKDISLFNKEKCRER